MPTFRYVILGGGMVAGYAARELVERDVGADALAIISADSALPYERPPLSKGFLAGRDTEESVFINSEDFYHEHGIEVRLNTTVTGLDAATKTLRIAGGEDVAFERLLIATGGVPRALSVPGAGLSNILLLRSLEDSKRIRHAYEEASRAVVVGAGFIGMEVASVLASKGLETTITFPEERVWERFFAPEMSAFFRRYYEERDVRFAAGERVTGFESAGDRLAAVLTSTGGRWSADLAVLGIGIAPAVDLFEGSGLALENGVVVNEYLETNLQGIYAAGDVASYQDVLFGRRRRIEHWDNAVEQGAHAARVMMGDRQAFRHVPYFFSDVFDLSYEYWGDPSEATRVVYRGDATSSSFSAWWLAGDRVDAAFVMNRPDEERNAAQAWIAERRRISANDLANEEKPLPVDR